MGKRKLFNGNYLDFINLPYEERQFILIQKDEEFNKFLKMIKRQDPIIIDLDEINWKKMAWILLRPYGFILYGSLIYLIYKTIKNKTGINFLLIHENISKNLEFPYGHPQKKTLYSGHPYEPNIYYTVADFHQEIVDSKLFEIQNILRCLGALEIELDCRDGLDLGFEVIGGIGLPRTESSPEIDVNAKYKKTTNRKYNITLQEKYEKHKEEPHLPEKLIWYPYENKWQHIVEQRLKYSLKEFSIEIESINSYGIDTNLALKVEDVGFKIGGKYKEFKNTKWLLSGKFK